MGVTIEGLSRADMQVRVLSIQLIITYLINEKNEKNNTEWIWTHVVQCSVVYKEK